MTNVTCPSLREERKAPRTELYGERGRGQALWGRRAM
jgi:hypothetical protein